MENSKYFLVPKALTQVPKTQAYREVSGFPLHRKFFQIYFLLSGISYISYIILVGKDT